MIQGKNRVLPTTIIASTPTVVAPALAVPVETSGRMIKDRVGDRPQAEELLEDSMAARKSDTAERLKKRPVEPGLTHRIVHQ
jgi:hypothetical protein